MVRILNAVIFLFLTAQLYAQDVFAMPDTILPVTFGVEKNPVKLVNRLIEGKTGEKEKFDAIFLWVTRNIRYDYYSYYSPSGTGMPRIDRILRHKRGIFLDYAFLMDSLCSLAGIKNVSIYGYAKDDLFDVNDSLFMDNHAWNAVKLDNFWYVYDATWASGDYKYQYTKFSLRLVKWRKKLVGRIKQSKITFKSTFKRVTECDTSEKTTTQAVYRRSFKNKFLLKLLSKFRLRIMWILSDKINPDYYLTQPEVFAITHFPDNPEWSLIAKRHIRDFEGDSAYYHLEKKDYAGQQRAGRYCGDCDNEFSLGEMEKLKTLKEKSLRFNKRNRFITSYCDFNISTLLYRNSIPVKDSLTKIMLIDSSLSFIQRSKEDLYQCRLNVQAESAMQKTKNRLKDILLFEDNKIHVDFIRNMMKQTYDETHKIDYFNSQIRANFRAYRRMQTTLGKLRGKVRLREKNFKSTEKLDPIKYRIAALTKAIDSLQTAIENDRVKYADLLLFVSKNLWTKVGIQDSLSSLFMDGINFRIHLIDIFKKPDVESRKKISGFEMKYARDIKELIYDPSNVCADLGFKIMSMIAERNELAVDLIKLKTELANEKIIEEKEVGVCIKLMLAYVQKDICWIISGSSKMLSVRWGYRSMTGREKSLDFLIRLESKAEYSRFKIISKEIDRRRRKFGGIANHNLKISSRRKTFLMRYKRAYLKSLKEARKKSKKKSEDLTF